MSDLPLVTALKLANFQELRFHDELVQTRRTGILAPTTKSEWVESNLPAQAASVIEAQYKALKDMRAWIIHWTADRECNLAPTTGSMAEAREAIAYAIALSERAP